MTKGATVMISSTNNLKYILKLIIIVMETQDNLVTKLHNIIIKSYKAVRIDNTIVNDLCFGIENLLNFLVDYDEPEINSRVLSLIALKNDLRLQQELSEIQIDLYLKEIKSMISKKVHLINNETWLKVCKCLAQIQYAYNILDVNSNVRNIYDSVVQEVVGNNIIYDRLLELSKDNVNYNYCDIGFVYFYYMLFYDKYPHAGYNSAIKAILAFWKMNKIEHYIFTDKEIEDELVEKKYNFIYK